jgi:AsmA protein
MAKVIKIIGIIFASIILLTAIGIFLLIHYIDPNQFKDEIDSAVLKQTGRHLSIGGSLNWSFFPWLGFRVENVALSNAKGFANTPFASAGEIDISVKFLPLVYGNIQVGNITINNLDINLVRNANGQTNWQDLSATPEIPVSTPTINTNSKNNNTENSNTPNINFSIANFTIVNSQVAFDDEKTKQKYTLENLYIDGDNVGTTQLFPLTISFTLNGNTLPKPLKLSFNANFNINSQLSSIAINQIETSINDLNIQGDISFNNVLSKPTFQGDFHLPDTNIKQLLQEYKITLPTMKNKDALSKVSTDLAFNGDTDNVTIKPLKIGVDSSTISGDASITNFSAPKISANLNVDNIDIDDYLPSNQGAPAATKNGSIHSSPVKPAAKPTVKKDAPINLPVEMLRNLNLTANIKLSQFSVANLALSAVNAQLSANRGVITLSPMTLKLYEGTATANASLNVTSATPNYTFSLDAKNIQSQPFLNDLMNKDFVTGSANLSANLTSSGNTVNTLISRLNGNSQFSFNNGTLKGVSVEYELARASALLNKGKLPEAPKSNTTPFGNASGTIYITNGVAKNSDFIIKNKAFTGQGSGTANLSTQKLDYTLNIAANNNDDLKGYKIPITMKGVLTSPSINVDTDSILQQVLNAQKKRLAADAKKQLKNEATKQLGKYVKSADINKALNNVLG